MALNDACNCSRWHLRNVGWCARLMILAICSLYVQDETGFVSCFSSHSFIGRIRHDTNPTRRIPLLSTAKDVEEKVVASHGSPATEQQEEVPQNFELDPKDIVKLFGRLAEKYIMLDGSAGLCCYSACSDCEYREPGGGYRMADQSAARPKWIPCYEERKFEALGKEHTSKWSIELFTDGPAVSKELFVERLRDMTYAPPLGGPYLAASSANIEADNTFVEERLFDLLVANGKDVLTKHRMSTQLKVLSEGDEGLTWPKFQDALVGVSS